mmetsp:Transcript_67075/g.111535  ORF Transcript_67075/g.111535 Transcript_67075/m.111535 type:complete len:203 (+) Transcript_67075:28-636(+)|eukprot:CAMPEP_0119336574 /NCGR_PEP_ID=MMETSP1333-20130426/92109_1 /TAXON_ID=418940 /ORGANISM="Scyphosphaera apsteinii, Strain RCC1455" /LENGTH=202 /DNA_ID=CAMNT_0007347397 /DNA_START=28 /DNA_END=636 /DNA_ORIENTATION=-
MTYTTDELLARLKELQGEINALFARVEAVGLYHETVELFQALKQLRGGLEALSQPGPSWLTTFEHVARELQLQSAQADALLRAMQEAEEVRAELGFLRRQWVGVMGMPLPWETRCSCCYALCPPGRGCSRNVGPGGRGHVVCEGVPLGGHLQLLWQHAPVSALLVPLMVLLACVACCWSDSRRTRRSLREWHARKRSRVKRA